MTLVTEKEAFEKWCPLSRVAENGSNVQFSFNRIQHANNHNLISCPPGSACIGSKCMAWRVGVAEHQRNLTPENRTPGLGYCGAFGKVEP